MNWAAIGAVSDMLGAAAVVLSLIYVAAQVRHNTTALSRAASADAIAGIRNWNETLIGDPAMARIFSQGVEDMNALDEDGRTRFIILMLNFLKTFEDMHYQFSKGAMEPEVWHGVGRVGPDLPHPSGHPPVLGRAAASLQPGLPGLDGRPQAPNRPPRRTDGRGGGWTSAGFVLTRNPAPAREIENDPPHYKRPRRQSGDAT